MTTQSSAGPVARAVLAAALLGLLPVTGLAQGMVEVEMSRDLTAARAAWLDGRYDGIWPVIEAEAEAGNPVAQNILGIGLTRPDGAQGLAYDPVAGHQWLTAAADQAFARAFHNLAIFWQQDHPGFATDYARAREMAERAVALGYPHANTVIGDLYRHGRGVDPDPVRAFEFYRRAADGGAFNGYRMTGYAYLNGEGVEKDAELGALYLERAVRAGDRVPLRDLAYLYEGNEGVPQDLLKSYLLYRHGVARGMADAAWDLGFFVAYPDYPGFWHDPVQGYGYCLLARARGYAPEDTDAEAECDTLAEGLSEDDRAAARAFSARFE